MMNEEKKKDEDMKMMDVEESKQEVSDVDKMEELKKIASEILRNRDKIPKEEIESMLRFLGSVTNGEIQFGSQSNDFRLFSSSYV